MSLELYRYSSSKSQYLVGAYASDNPDSVSLMDGDALVIKAKPTFYTPKRNYRFSKNYFVCHRYFAMALVLLAHEHHGFHAPTPKELIEAIEDHQGYSFLDGCIQCKQLNENEYETRITGKYLSVLKLITNIQLS